MKKFLLVGALGALGALVFSMSGCFIMRTLTYDRAKVKPGGVYKTLMSVSAGESGPNDYPFFFFLSEAGSLPTNGGKFDTKGVFSGPVAIKHTDQSDNLVAGAEDACPFPTGKGPLTVTGDNIVVTKHPFHANNPLKYIQAKLPIRLQPDNDQGDGYALWMGTWSDDGDGVAEDPAGNEDDYSCQPAYTSFIAAKGAQLPKF